MTPFLVQLLEEMGSVELGGRIRLQAKAFVKVIVQSVASDDARRALLLTKRSPDMLRPVLGAWKFLIDQRSGFEQFYGSPEDLAAAFRFDNAVSTFTDTALKEFQKRQPATEVVTDQSSGSRGATTSSSFVLPSRPRTEGHPGLP